MMASALMQEAQLVVGCLEQGALTLTGTVSVQTEGTTQCSVLYIRYDVLCDVAVPLFSLFAPDFYLYLHCGQSVCFITSRFKSVSTVTLERQSLGRARRTLMEKLLAEKTSQTRRNGEGELKATSQKMRRKNGITPMKKERTLMMKGQGTEN